MRKLYVGALIEIKPGYVCSEQIGIVISKVPGNPNPVWIVLLGDRKAWFYGYELGVL